MSKFNDSHKQFIQGCFQDIHRRMAEMEAWLAQSQVASPFSQHIPDLSPTEKKVLQDYFARIRSTMLACLEEGGIPLEVHRTGLRWVLQCGMMFLDIAVAEMAPKRLAGYGKLEESDQAAIAKIQNDLYRLIGRASTYLRQRSGQNLNERLKRLESAHVNVRTLTLLDRIINRWQLVEFRPMLDSIVGRLEVPQFEIAVFGRVSSGKSSLLNHVVGADVLPVGVTPITAVPTRLLRGEVAQAQISFAELAPRIIAVDQLREYASEEGNPGNKKHVTNIVVQLPSAKLREGVVFVDTPGTGSLALSGSAETLAYLPRCDLGVVLIDAASSLNQDDLALLRSLYQAGIPAQVLLSKADLLTPPDRQRMAQYIRNHLQEDLGLDLQVHPVSTVTAEERLLTAWFAEEIGPLLDKNKSLTEISLQRKIAYLRESVLAVLETLLARGKGESPNGQAEIDIAAVRGLLADADKSREQAQVRCQNWAADDAALKKIIVQDAAEALASSRDNEHSLVHTPLLTAAQRVLAERGRLAHELVTNLQQTLSRALISLRRTAPLAQVDAGAVLDLRPRGLPILDLQALQRQPPAARPWWSSLFPAMAVWHTQRKLEKNQGDVLRQQVDLYERQIQAWLRTSLAQLTEAYEAQAEVFREQLRRLTATGQKAHTSADEQEMENDLRQLRQIEQQSQGLRTVPDDGFSSRIDCTRPKLSFDQDDSFSR